MRRRVVVTGMGAITPLGHTPASLFESLVAGKSGIGLIRSFDASGFPSRCAAQVTGLDLGQYVANPKRWQHAGLSLCFALAASQQAVAEAGLIEAACLDRTRCGVYVGLGEGYREFHFPRLITALARAWEPEKAVARTGDFMNAWSAQINAMDELEQELHAPSGHLASHFELLGPNYTCQTACAAGSQAIGEATELIRQGEADVMLAGGTHSMINAFSVSGFCLLTALSTQNDEPARASRPFDLKRDGFVLGEGAGLVVLEELEHARRRGANILAEISGYGSTADAYRLTDSHPEARGAAACIEQALRDARLAPEDIGYVNAHGTSTPVNDRVETLALKKAFHGAARSVPISSSKSMVGHLISAAGAVELIVSIESIRRGVLHPTINYENPDPACDLDYIPNQPREKRVDHVLSNSFGFGGQNVALIVSRAAA